MQWLGDIKVGRTLRWAFDTQVDGLPATLSAITVRVYKDAGTTESSAGVSVTADFDSKTGLNLVTVDTSADGAFYSAGSDFDVVLQAGTLGGQTILRVLGNFSIENRAVNWAQVVSPASTVGLSGTTVKAVTDRVTANTDQIEGVDATNQIRDSVLSDATRFAGANIDVAVSTRLPSASISLSAGAVTVGTNNDKTAYALSAGERTSIADALLTRDFAAVAGAASRCMLHALRFLMNKRSIAAGTLTVMKEDDTTPAWTATVVTTAGDPVSSVDPA